MSDSNAKILVQNTKWIYISKIITQILGLIASILVIRKLDVDIFGTYNLLLNSFVVFEIFALSAVTNLFNRYIPELLANKEYKKYRKFISGGFLYSTLLFSVLLGLLFIFQDEFSRIFKILDFEKYVLAFYIFNYTQFLRIIFDTALKSMLLHKRVAKISILNSFLRTVLYIIFLKYLNVNLLLYIEIFLSLVYVSQSLYIYLRNVSTFDLTIIPETNTPVTFKRIRKFGLLSLVNELGSGIVGKTSDYFIVAALSNPYHVGLFAFSHQIFGYVNQVLPVKDILTVVRPMFFKKFSGEYNIDEFRNMYSFMIKILLPLYILPALYFLFFGKYVIIYIFDSKYLEAYWITVIILFSNFLISFFYPMGLVVLLKEKMEYALYSKIVAIFSIAAGIFGMKYYGLIGVVLASFIGDLFKNILIMYLMRNYKEMSLNLYDFKNFIIMILITLPFISINMFQINVYLFICFSIIYVFFNIIILIKFHPFNNYDINILVSISNSSTVFKKIGNVIYSINKYLGKINFQS